MKNTEQWYSERLQQPVKVVRWGHYGVPLLLFPTAGGDAEEVERFHLVQTLLPFIQEGRLKVYSVDSVAGQTWLMDHSVAHRVWIQSQFDKFIREEFVPMVCHDCEVEQIEMMVAGSSIGAYNALLAICRHPEVFSRAICMSGTYNLERWMEGEWFEEFHHISPIHFVPGLPDGSHLDQLRERFVLIATGEGDNENPGESWKVADVLGQQQIPNRVDLWGPQWIHDWGTWRAMLPQYVDEMLGNLADSTTAPPS